MKRKCFLLIVFLLFSLCACMSGTPQNSSTSALAFPDANGDASQETEKDSTSASLRIVSGLRDDISWGCSAEKGFYSLLARGDGSVNLRYMDYESLREIILCGDPNCMHNSENCTGWIAPGCGGAVPFATDQYFCMVYLGNSYGFDGGVPPKIVRRDLNGKNETTLIAFSSSETILRPFVSDGQALYFLKRSFQLDLDAPQGMYNLMRLDLDTGTVETLRQWDDLHTMSLVGANGGKLLLRDIYMQAKDAGDPPMPHMVYAFSAFDTYTGESADLWSWQTDAEILERGNGRVLDGSYYYYDAKRRAVLRHNFESGETAVLLADAPALLENAAGACFDCLVDGKLCIQNGTGLYAALSVEDGAMTEITLSYPEGDKTRPVRIVESAGDFYLVVIGSEQVMMQGYDYDGLPIDFPSFEDTLAFIAKQDYWGNQPNYIYLNRYNGA